MDPGDENMIATYNDPLAERGGVVFDAGFERFFSGRYGNKKYMENVAVWLEENSSSANSRNILIYNT
ncbi:MAG TPA: permease, partial [Nitrospirae bacterium]|nr:permease [Nitrospirota bacterium]